MTHLHILLSLSAVLALVLFGRRKSIERARETINQARQAETGAPGTILVPNQVGRYPLEQAVAGFLANFSTAVQTRSLTQFSVEEALADVRHAVPRQSGLLRPIAGWCLLLGLVVTLFNLQSSVQGLSAAFQTIARTSGVTSARNNPKSNSELDASKLIAGNQSRASLSNQGAVMRQQASQLQQQMSEVAGSAATAFSWGLCFIGAALGATVCAAVLEHLARGAVTELSFWAHQTYVRLLPEQLPVTHGDLARELKTSSNAMSAVVEKLGTVAAELNSMTGLLSALSSVSDTIREAMGKLPQDLRNSMSDVSSELVQGLTTTLGESNEHTKKILQIYADQEFRIREIRGFVEAMNGAAESIKASAGHLSPLPKTVEALNASVKDNAVAAVKVAKSASDLASRLPLAELTAALGAIDSMQAMFLDSQQQADMATAKLVAIAESLSGKDGIARDIKTSLAQAALLHKTLHTAADKLAASAADEPLLKALNTLADRTLALIETLKAKDDSEEWRIAIGELVADVTALKRRSNGDSASAEAGE